MTDTTTNVDLDVLNDAAPDEAAALLRHCCGSRRWVSAMLRRRPFESLDELLRAAQAASENLDRDDWLEAFSHHPRIGDREGAARASRSGPGWEQAEQAGAASADAEVLAEIARLNDEYEQRFGYIYLVCATGRSGAELLQILRERLDSDPESELETAAREQQRITELRLRKLVAA